MKTLSFFSLLVIIGLHSCNTKVKQEHWIKSDSVTTVELNTEAKGDQISIEVKKGISHNHPLMAIWIEDEYGTYIQTIYVSKSLAKGIFEHGDKAGGKWKPGEARRPAALPHWAFKRGIKEEDGLYIPTTKTPIPDAYSGATPPGDFKINSHLDKTDIGKVIIVKLEINQSWDWNEFWANNKYPDDKDYMTSSQPAIVYTVSVNTQEKDKYFVMKAIGHSHYSGKDGNITTDLSTITTALQIISEAKVMLK